jgi:hypothetical protein
MDAKQMRELIKDVLEDAQLYSEEATELLLGTMSIESNMGQYIKQLGGPARGFFQIEPATEKDIWVNFIAHKKRLKDYLATLGYTEESPDSNRMLFDIRYQILMARIHYLRVAEPIPLTSLGQAKYWKKYYNTTLGKGTIKKYLVAFAFNVHYGSTKDMNR